MPVITIIDTLAVQGYVFRSNRLRDIAGGSYLVRQATEPIGLIHDIVTPDQIIAGAGGNLVLKFPSLSAAHLAMARYSRKLLEQCPGLEVCVEHQEYISGELAKACRDALAALAARKLHRTPLARPGGLGIDARCAATGLPAIDIDASDHTLVSADIAARRQMYADHLVSLERIAELDHNGIKRTLQMPTEFDQMGRTHGDTSLLGVVHLDGNGIGKGLKHWLDGQIAAGVSDDDFREGYRALASALHKRLIAVEQTLVDVTRQHIIFADNRYQIRHQHTQEPILLHAEGAQVYFPLRVILASGDDLTFVCDGRLAPALAGIALETYERQPTPEGWPTTDSLTAAAGVALVDTHAPFARAYALAEALCRKAKDETKTRGKSAIDWHLATSLGEPLDAIRDREYLGGTLTKRPYLLYGIRDSWQWLRNDVLNKKDNRRGLYDETWTRHRNKLKELRDAVVKHTEVEAVVGSWRSATGELPDGIASDRRAYLTDALELLDIYYPLSVNNEVSA